MGSVYHTTRTFAHMKRWLGGQYFGIDNELQTSVDNWLKAQAFYGKGIRKLVPCYEKCLGWNDDHVDYVEK